MKEDEDYMLYEKYDKIMQYCTNNMIFFQPSGIYGLEKGFYHYGDMGVKLRNNIKQSWVQTFVDGRDDVDSFEGTVLSLTDVWKGSGHKIHFDFIIGCRGGGGLHWYSPNRLELSRNEIEEILNIETPKEFKELILHKNVRCPICKETLKDFRSISTIFKATMEREDLEGYDSSLRPETCQDVFLNFKKINGRELRLPFGVAQIGKVFRNETTQRRRIFRCREFELMELEYFVDPRNEESDLEYKEFEIYAKSSNMDQEELMKMKDLVNSKIIESKWLAYWIIESIKWLETIGIERKNLRIKQQSEERAFYSSDTWDVEYRFDWGWDEIEGVAYRKDYDMRSHNEYYKSKYHRDSNLICDLGEYKFPYVTEMSYGVERILLAILYESYSEKEGMPILKFKPQIAPYTVAVFPHKQRQDLIEAAMKIHDKLKTKFSTKYYGRNVRIGEKYHRFDKLGVPFIISVGEEIKEGKVSISDRYAGKEDLVDIDSVDLYIWKKIYS